MNKGEREIVPTITSRSLYLRTRLPIKCRELAPVTGGRNRTGAQDPFNLRII